MAEKFYLPVEIVGKRDRGMVLTRYPYSNGTWGSALVDEDALSTADKIAEDALEEYRKAILDVTDMNLRERKEAFGIEDGHCPSVQGLMELYSPAEFIEKVKAYKERPKTGEVYADWNGNKRYVLFVKNETVHYIYEAAEGKLRGHSEASLSQFTENYKKIDSETPTDFNEFFKGMNK